MKNIKGRAIVKVNLDLKNSFTFSNGTKIRLERDVENLNRRETQAVNAVIVSSDYIPVGSDLLIHHNSTHEVNRIFDRKLENESDGFKYFSLPETDCFLYREPGKTEYKPCNGIATALRIYEPYTGSMEGVSHKLVRNKLFITSGKLKNKVCDVLKAADYEIIYQGDDDREARVIRIRHYENEFNEREEIIAVDNYLTKFVLKGDLLVGLNSKDAQKFVK
jgi:hypothetical protein